MGRTGRKEEFTHSDWRPGFFFDFMIPRDHEFLVFLHRMSLHKSSHHSSTVDPRYLTKCIRIISCRLASTQMHLNHLNHVHYFPSPLLASRIWPLSLSLRHGAVISRFDLRWAGLEKYSLHSVRPCLVDGTCSLIDLRACNRLLM